MNERLSTSKFRERTRVTNSCLLVSASFFAGLGAKDVTANPANSSRTAVIADEKAGVIRFVVDGREVARIESGGLYVRSDIQYGGKLIDVGTGQYENHIKARQGAKP